MPRLGPFSRSIVLMRHLAVQRPEPHPVRGLGSHQGRPSGCPFRAWSQRSPRIGHRLPRDGRRHQGESRCRPGRRLCVCPGAQDAETKSRSLPRSPRRHRALLWLVRECRKNRFVRAASSIPRSDSPGPRTARTPRASAGAVTLLASLDQAPPPPELQALINAVGCRSNEGAVDQAVEV